MTWRSRIGLIALLPLALGAGSARAVSGRLDLGKPTSSLPPNSFFPLSGFRRIPRTLRSHGRAEILVISPGAYVDEFFGVEVEERWPIVKAVQQFGTLTGTTPIDKPVITFTFQGKQLQNQLATTIDWNHASYRSRYLNFVHKDLQRYDPSSNKSVPFQKLGKLEKTLYHLYAKAPTGTIGGPLIVIGDYEQYVSQIPLDGDLRGPSGPSNQPGPPLSFGVIQSALATGKDPPQSSLVEDVNAEANVITALICHADGKQPASVCGRAVIKGILRHVK